MIHNISFSIQFFWNINGITCIDIALVKFLCFNSIIKFQFQLCFEFLGLTSIFEPCEEGKFKAHALWNKSLMRRGVFRRI